MAMASARILKALAVMGELFGRAISRDAAECLDADLSGFPEDAVLTALSRCRRECRVFPTLSDIISRIDDGRPGAEEAWALIPQDESGSVIWSEEMAAAYGVARKLLAEGDPIAARQAFKECYQKAVLDARASRRPVRFSPSFGHDSHGRAAAVSEALDKKRITEVETRMLLPDYSHSESQPLLESDSSNRQGLTSIADIVKQLESKREASN